MFSHSSYKESLLDHKNKWTQVKVINDKVSYYGGRNTMSSIRILQVYGLRETQLS